MNGVREPSNTIMTFLIFVYGNIIWSMNSTIYWISSFSPNLLIAEVILDFSVLIQSWCPKMKGCIFNIDAGYLEGLCRGFKCGILKQSDYLNLVQCETLEGMYANWFDIIYFPHIIFRKICWILCFLVTFNSEKSMLNWISRHHPPVIWFLVYRFETALARDRLRYISG